MESATPRVQRRDSLRQDNRAPLTELSIRRDKCPVSLKLAREHVADLRRARLAETPFG
jgi:hypothetical protein